MKKMVNVRRGFSLTDFVYMFLFILLCIIFLTILVGGIREIPQEDRVFIKSGDSIQFATSRDRFSVKLKQEDYRSHFEDGESYRFMFRNGRYDTGWILLFENSSGEQMVLTQEQFDGELTVANFTLIKGGWTGTRPTNTSSSHGADNSSP